MVAADINRLDRLLTLAECAKIIGVSKPTIFRMMKMKDFPPVIRLSERVVRVRLIDLNNWLNKKKKRRK